jgi:hypothetical protein
LSRHGEDVNLTERKRQGKDVQCFETNWNGLALNEIEMDLIWVDTI